MEHKKLTRSARNKILAGVCGGIGEYLDLDPNLVRLVFLVLLIIQPAAILLYLLLALILPQAGSQDEEIEKAENAAAPANAADPDSTSERLWLGVGLTVFGFLLLLNNLGLVWLNWKWLGAFVLIGLGVYLLLLKED